MTAEHNSVAFFRTRLLSFTDSDTGKKLLPAILVGLGSVLLGYFLLVSDGNLFVGGALLGVLSVVLITIYRVDWGLNLFMFMIFFFDQFPVPGFEGPTYQVGYFLNLNVIRYLPKFDQGVVTPMELHVLFLVFVWLLVVVLRKNTAFTPIPLKLPAGLFFLSFVGSVAYGVARGGDFVVSLWETRALFYLGFMFVFIPQIIQTRRQLEVLVWFCMAGIAFKALQGAVRFASLGFSFGSWPYSYETLTNHEDPVFIVTLFVLLFGLYLFHVRGSQRIALAWLALPILIGFVAGQRRAAYASFMASLVAFVVLIPAAERRTILKIVSPLLLLFVLYVGVFWNSNSKVATIAQQFKATVTNEPGSRGEKDVISTLYRKAEAYNLAYTFRFSPAIGTGFGRPYLRPLRPWGGDFSLSDYIPHNQILWIFVEMGVVGGFLFWLFFNSFVFRSAMVFFRLKDPYLRAVCAVCVIAVINQFVVSYVDMQIAWYRSMVYLGLLMGLVPVLEKLDRGSTETVHSGK